MATEESKHNSTDNNNSITTLGFAAAVAPGSPTSGAVPTTLPPYPEMILDAIDALNEKTGCNKSSISKQIESTYGNLPPAHSTLLSHHLNRMKATGQLVMVKNNYLKPDPNAPPRRGRGRPPKAKPALPPGVVPPPPRPRGRPPKSRDPLSPVSPPKKAPTTAPSGGSGRKRGRPPKSAVSRSEIPQSPKVAKTTPSQSPAGASPRGRGRPPKVKPAVAAPVGA